MGQTFLVDENCKPTDQTTTIPPKKTKKKPPNKLKIPKHKKHKENYTKAHHNLFAQISD